MLIALAVAAAVTLVAVVAWLQFRPKSLDDLAREQIGDGAGRCRDAGLSQGFVVYSCQDGKGSTVCVVRSGDDLHVLARPNGLAC